MTVLSELRSGDAGIRGVNKRGFSLLGASARIAAFMVLVWIIGHRLTGLGLANVLSQLPSAPLYYGLFLVFYFAGPAFELGIYGPLWKAPARRLAPVLVRKRVLNEGVLGYSGEAYLALWARRELSLRGRDVLEAIKDSNFISSFASTSVTVALAIVVLAVAGGRASFVTGMRYQIMFAALFGLAAVVTAFVVRRRLLSLPPSFVRRATLLHFVRLALVLGVQVTQWTIVLPAVPLIGWLIILSAYLIATRVPFLPSYDLVLLGLGLSLTSTVEAPKEAVAGLFLAGAGLSQAANLTLFVVTSFAPRRPAIAPREEQSLEHQEAQAVRAGL